VRARNVGSVELWKNDMQLCSWGVAHVMNSKTGECVVMHGGVTEGVD
jgi:hypothetical protein